MLRRIAHLNKAVLRYALWKPTTKTRKLKASFLENFTIPYKDRLSFCINQRRFQSQHRYYYSQNKLQCFLHYSFSVPSKKTRVSRFFLGRGVERLMFGGYQK